MEAPLNNFHFTDYYHKSPLFAGVFSRDNLPYLFEDKFYVINLDNKRGDGTHWVVVFNCYRECIYFDSFAVSPPEEVLRRMRKTGKAMLMNVYRVQALNSINCGFICLYVLDNLLKKRKFIDILTDFDPKNYYKNDAWFTQTN